MDSLNFAVPPSTTRTAPPVPWTAYLILIARASSSHVLPRAKRLQSENSSRQLQDLATVQYVLQQLIVCLASMIVLQSSMTFRQRKQCKGMDGRGICIITSGIS